MKRRSLIVGAGALGAAVLAGLYRFTDLLVKHYPPTPYDDVLGQIVDRDQAARLGTQVNGAPDAATLASQLRPRLERGLRPAVDADIAAARLVEVHGWLLPQTVTLMAALAAKVQA